MKSLNVWWKVAPALAALFLTGGLSSQASGQALPELQSAKVKGRPIVDFLSAGGIAAVFGAQENNGSSKSGIRDNGRGGNTFVNDPCLDPPPTAPEPERRRGTVQSETEIAVLNVPGSMGKKMVAGYNDSEGFYDRNRGLSGFSYSTDGGNTWIDGGGLPPALPGPPRTPADTPGLDGFFGDPVVVVHHATRSFFYSSIYKRPNDTFTLSVSRGRFRVAPPQGVESIANTRCLSDPTKTGTPNPPKTLQERIIWEPPVVAVKDNIISQFVDFLDKEWLYVDQTTGTLYVTYTRFVGSGIGVTLATPIELSRCTGCAYKTTISEADWEGPFTIVANEVDTFNQATAAITTPSGRVVVTWVARVFSMAGLGPESEQRIEYAFSDTDGTTFGPELLIAKVNPQGEPPGYNRMRDQILNAPYITVDKGADDGVFTATEVSRPGFRNVYVTYFSGKTPVTQGPPFLSQADIFVSRSTDNATTFEPRVKVNDDPGVTSHVFPTVQANKNGIVYVNWLDRRKDAANNRLTDNWANVSKTFGVTFGPDKLQTDIATNWFVRADARPNFGDYNSSDLLGFNDFVVIWADGRFWPPGGDKATPDAIFTIANGLGVGNLSN